MLNLRQLNKADNTETNWDVQHSSRFSIAFRAPSDLLGNIGEPLDYSQSEQLQEGDSSTDDTPAEEQPRVGMDPESVQPAAGRSGAHQDTAGTVADPSVTCWEDNKQEIPRFGVPGARSDGFVDIIPLACTDNACVNLIRTVCRPPCLYPRSLGLRIISFAGAGDRL